MSLGLSSCSEACVWWLLRQWRGGTTTHTHVLVLMSFPPTQSSLCAVSTRGSSEVIPSMDLGAPDPLNTVNVTVIYMPNARSEGKEVQV